MHAVYFNFDVEIFSFLTFFPLLGLNSVYGTIDMGDMVLLLAALLWGSIAGCCLMLLQCTNSRTMPVWFSA